MGIDNRALPEAVRKQKRLYRALLAVIGITFAIASAHTGFNPLAIFAEGHNFIDFAVNDLYPPAFSKALGVWDALLQTIAMSLVATFLGGALSFCLCFFASYQTAPHHLSVKAVRALASIQRNIPGTIWLFIFRMAFGIGTAVGMIALLFNTVGFLTRMFAEVLDEVGRESMEALDSVGAGYLPKLFQCVIPASVPGFISWLLYAVEINIRASGVVGALGGGGIGLVLTGYLSSFRYHIAFAIILLLAGTTIIVSFIASYLREKVLA